MPEWLVPPQYRFAIARRRRDYWRERNLDVKHLALVMAINDHPTIPFTVGVSPGPTLWIEDRPGFWPCPEETKLAHGLALMSSILRLPVQVVFDGVKVTRE